MLRAAQAKDGASTSPVSVFGGRPAYFVTKIGAQRKPAPDAPLAHQPWCGHLFERKPRWGGRVTERARSEMDAYRNHDCVADGLQCSYPNRGFSASISGNFVPVPRPPHLAFYTVYNPVPGVDFMVDVNGALIGR